MGWTWVHGNGGIAPVTKHMSFIPTFSSEANDFALVEQAIHDRNLGSRYLRSLSEAVLDTNETPPWLMDECWRLWRAPLDVKCRAALQVLAPVPPSEETPQ